MYPEQSTHEERDLVNSAKALETYCSSAQSQSSSGSQYNILSPTYLHCVQTSVHASARQLLWLYAGSIVGERL
jgi:hypothetical protein